MACSSETSTVSAQACGAPMQPGQLGGAGRALRVPVDGDDPRAGLGEREGRGPADAAARAR